RPQCPVGRRWPDLWSAYSLILSGFTICKKQLSLRAAFLLTDGSGGYDVAVRFALGPRMVCAAPGTGGVGIVVGWNTAIPGLSNCCARLSYGRRAGLFAPICQALRSKPEDLILAPQHQGNLGKGYLQILCGTLKNHGTTTSGKADQTLGVEQRHKFGKVDVLPLHLPLHDPALAYAGLVNCGDPMPHVPGNQNQAGKQQYQAARQHGADSRPLRRASDQGKPHPDQGQHDPGTGSDPFGPGAALNGKRAQVA